MFLTLNFLLTKYSAFMLRKAERIVLYHHVRYNTIRSGHPPDIVDGKQKIAFWELRLANCDHFIDPSWPPLTLPPLYGLPTYRTEHRN